MQRLAGVFVIAAVACAKTAAPPAALPPRPSLEPAALVQEKPADPLPSWNDGAAKQAITSFVARVTRQGGPDFVALPERIAVFDNDGTLWSEQPIYVQFAFCLDRVRELAPQHPEWKTKEPFKSVLAGDLKGALAGGDKALYELVAAAQGGVTTDEFAAAVTQWLATAKHPKYARPYTELVYQPMLEVLSYLRANGFKTFIVSGGNVEFMRPWAEKVYGIAPEYVVGSMIETQFELRDGKGVLVQQPGVAFVDDGPGKPTGIHRNIGRRPIAAFGNSDGDQQMLEYTASGPGARLALLVHHTDAARETAYDRDSHIGRLDKTLDEAKTRNWVVASMKDDWKTIFPR
jgi:phosphoserine phosphatase